MRERAQELKAGDADGENAVLTKFAAMPTTDRIMGVLIHAIVKASAPALSPRLWYGMPACSNKNGSAVCHFQAAQKFKTRYSTLGFSYKANLDHGHTWPIAFAMNDLTPAEEARIGVLVRKAAS